MLKLGIEVVEMSAVVEFHYGEVVAESRIGVAIDITTEVESQIGRFEGEGFHHLQGLVETFVGVGDTIGVDDLELGVFIGREILHRVAQEEYHNGMLSTFLEELFRYEPMVLRDYFNTREGDPESCDSSRIAGEYPLTFEKRRGRRKHTGTRFHFTYHSEILHIASGFIEMIRHPSGEFGRHYKSRLFVAEGHQFEFGEKSFKT